MEELQLLDYVRIVLRRKWLIIALVLAAGASSYVFSKLTDKVYEARSKILVRDQTSSSMSILNEISGMPKNQVANYVEILKSRSLARAVLLKLNLPATSEALRDLQSSLTVQPIQGTDTIEIRVRSTIPLRAQRFANTYVTCFIERNLADNQEDARLARQFIEEQLAVISGRLTKAEAALTRYQKEAKIVSATEEVSQAVEKLAQFEADKAALDVALAQAHARLDKVQQQLSAEEQTITSAKILARNPVYEQYRQKLSELHTELAGALAQYTEKHPAVLALRAQIEQVQADLAKEMEMILQSETQSVNPVHQAAVQETLQLQAEITADAAGKSALDKQISIFDRKLASLPDKEMQLARLMREKASAESIYTLLVTKKSEMEITEHMRTADVRLVDPAYRPAVPIKPNTKMNVAVAVFLGLFLGIGLAFLLEYLDPSFKTRDEAAAALGLPVFGMIPDDEAFHDNEGRKKHRSKRRRHRSGTAKEGLLGRVGL